jgi:hypothetical protein
MNEHITSAGIEAFLKDFKTTSTTEIFETGKQKEEIIQIAKAKMGSTLRTIPISQDLKRSIPLLMLPTVIKPAYLRTNY